MAEPLVSVLMPAYNAEAYIGEAIQSVLTQTESDFELLVVDDCSTDGTSDVVCQFDDPRIRLIENPHNLGLAESLHQSMPLCRGEFIARMDNDDICEPDRLARQVSFLRAHSDIGLVGGAIHIFGDAAIQAHTHVFPLEHEDIRATLLFYCALAHPTLMFRRDVVARGLVAYSDEYRHADDYHLWSRLLTQVRAANLPECVLRYRLHAHQTRSAHADRQYAVSVRVRKGLLDQVGVRWSEEDIALHESIITARYENGWAYLNSVASWFQRIVEANRGSRYWEEDALKRVFSAKCAEIGRHLGLRRQPSAASAELGYFLAQTGYRGDGNIRYVLRHAKRSMRHFLGR